jgi:hypothetical protein
MKSARRPWSSVEQVIPTVSAFDRWAGSVDEKSGALERAVTAEDWTSIGVLANEFSGLLRAVPDRRDARARKIFENAQHLINRILPLATAARDGTRTEIKRLANGRRAVSAYR